MRKYGLIGYPLGHSFSKKYFTEKFIREGISDCYYENYELKSIEGFRTLILENPDLLGLNVTIPYKSEIFRFVDEIDSEAKEIGAVNVLKIKRSENRLIICGYNSDITGIRDSILPFIREDISNAIIFGSGGSSKAVSYVLRQLGLNVFIISREKKEGTINYSDIDSALIKECKLIVNSTPLGMYPNLDSIPDINYSMLNKSHVLFDLVYNPEYTAFLKKGGERGCSIITGIKMLHSQAERSWEIWNNNNL
jgi:shikimate dehydrogenase